MNAENEQLKYNVCPTDAPQAPQRSLRKAVHCLNHNVEIQDI